MLSVVAPVKKYNIDKTVNRVSARLAIADIEITNFGRAKCVSTKPVPI
jgi:hypothetical protein